MTLQAPLATDRLLAHAQALAPYTSAPVSTLLGAVPLAFPPYPSEAEMRSGRMHREGQVMGRYGDYQPVAGLPGMCRYSTCLTCQCKRLRRVVLLNRKHLSSKPIQRLKQKPPHTLNSTNAKWIRPKYGISTSTRTCRTAIENNICMHETFTSS